MQEMKQNYLIRLRVKNKAQTKKIQQPSCKSCVKVSTPKIRKNKII
jgi:hypothetical protein